MPDIVFIICCYHFHCTTRGNNNNQVLAVCSWAHSGPLPWRVHCGETKTCWRLQEAGHARRQRHARQCKAGTLCCTTLNVESIPHLKCSLAWQGNNSGLEDNTAFSFLSVHLSLFFYLFFNVRSGIFWRGRQSRIHFSTLCDFLLFPGSLKANFEPRKISKLESQHLPPSQHGTSAARHDLIAPHPLLTLPGGNLISNGRSYTVLSRLLVFVIALSC